MVAKILPKSQDVIQISEESKTMAGAGANSTKLPPQAPHLESSGQTITLRRGLVPAEIWNNSQCRPGGVEAARKHIVASVRRSNAETERRRKAFEEGTAGLTARTSS